MVDTVAMWFRFEDAVPLGSLCVSKWTVDWCPEPAAEYGPIRWASFVLYCVLSHTVGLLEHVCDLVQTHTLGKFSFFPVLICTGGQLEHVCDFVRTDTSRQFFFFFSY